MTFQAGDVCEVVPTPRGRFNDWAGRRVVITRAIATRPAGRVCYATSPMPRKHPELPGRRFAGWWPESLRKIDPPEWEAPVTKTEDASA